MDVFEGVGFPAAAPGGLPCCCSPRALAGTARTTRTTAWTVPTERPGLAAPAETRPKDEVSSHIFLFHDTADSSPGLWAVDQRNRQVNDRIGTALELSLSLCGRIPTRLTETYENGRV